MVYNFDPLNHTSIYKKSELKVFKNTKILDEIFSNWSKVLLRKCVYKTLESC